MGLEPLYKLSLLGIDQRLTTNCVYLLSGFEPAEIHDMDRVVVLTQY